MRDTNFFQEAESKFRILEGRYSNRTRGRKARREGGGNQDNPRDEKLIRSVFKHDEKPIRSVLEHDKALAQTRRSGLNNTSISEDGSLFISLSTPQPLSEPPETNSLFEACLNTTKPLPKPAGGGLLLPCQRTAACLFLRALRTL